MKVDWDTEVCGIRIIRIRNLFRALRDRQFNTNAVGERLNISGPLTNGLIEEFLHRRWIERVHRPSASIDWFELTDDGISLAAAKAIPRITRAKAEQVLSGP